MGDQFTVQTRAAEVTRRGAPARSLLPIRPHPILQRKCTCGGSPGIAGECTECSKERSTTQRRATNDAELSTVPPIVHEVLRSPGQPLDANTRAFMESRFGHDFSQVRVHTDARAAESAQVVNALAYTIGRDIVFGTGRYVPGTNEGKRLLAHELTHVIQQRGAASVSRASSLDMSRSGDAGEGEAERAEALVARGDRIMSAMGVASLGRSLLQRECLTGSACTSPIPGAPGQFVATETTAEAPKRTARAAEPPATTTASGHGRRAVNLEQLARDGGYDLSLVHGIFVDQDMSPDVGGWSRLCKDFVGFVPPYTGDPATWCVFIPDAKEREAELFFSDATASSIGGMVRELWRATTIQLIAHELGHVAFKRSPHPALSGVTCVSSTEIYRSGSTVYDLNFYLDELSAIMSEFPPLFRAARAGSRPVRQYVRTWFDYKVDTAGESIKGILTALRCKCDCGDVDKYVRDTFIFTASSWTPAARVIFNTIMARRPGISWPLQGDPICIDNCETQFQDCTRHSSDGATCLAERSSCFNGCVA